MSASIGDGIAVVGLAAGFVGYLYIKHQSLQKKTEIIHHERMAAMDKGIPLPEFPLEPTKQISTSDEYVIPILGLVLLTLSLGTMIVLALNLSAADHSMWICPLPFAFLGAGFVGFHFLKNGSGR